MSAEENYVPAMMLRLSLLFVFSIMLVWPSLAVRVSQKQQNVIDDVTPAAFCNFNEDTIADCIADRPEDYVYLMGSVDHTYGALGGRYIGMSSYEVGKHKKRGASSPSIFSATTTMFPTSEGYCVLFYYSMKGKDVAKLSVTTVINGGESYPVFEATGEQSEDWLMQQVDLDSEYSSNPLQLRFDFYTNVYRDSWNDLQKQHGIIGIDDLYVYNTSCANVPDYPASYAYEFETEDNTTSHYKFYTEAKNWTAAFDTCRRDHPRSALVSVDSEEEQNFLTDAIVKDWALRITGEAGFYTSGNDRNTEKAFRWSETGYRRSMPFTFWKSGQPNNVAGNQDCLLMQYPQMRYAWGDVNCDTTHPFICEINIPDMVDSNLS